MQYFAYERVPVGPCTFWLAADSFATLLQHLHADTG